MRSTEAMCSRAPPGARLTRKSPAPTSVGPSIFRARADRALPYPVRSDYAPRRTVCRSKRQPSRRW
jgi:hypothetical protein